MLPRRGGIKPYSCMLLTLIFVHVSQGLYNPPSSLSLDPSCHHVRAHTLISLFEPLVCFSERRLGGILLCI